MPDWQPAVQAPPPVVPAPVVDANAVPRIPLAAPGRSDQSRPWSRDGARMTPELQQDTQPYLEAVMKMGADFKLAHATRMSEKVEAKLIKAYQAANPLPKDATGEQRQAHEAGARAMLERFQQQLPINVEVHNATRDLRNRYQDLAEGRYDPARQQEYEQAYHALRVQAGRNELSPLEAALPLDSPLRTKLDPLTGGLRDPATGLYAKLQVMGEGANQKNVLMFGGTGVGGALKAQLVADAGQFMGGVPKGYEQAAMLAGQLRGALPEARLETAGHSLGGGLATYAALKLGQTKATCFNAAALGGGCKAAIGANLDQAKENVRHINVRGDLVGDGIGQIRQPIQKAVDYARAGVGNVQGAAQMAVQRAEHLTSQQLNELRQGAQRVGNVAQQAGQRVQQAADQAIAPIRQPVQGALNQVRAGAGNMQNAAEMAVQRAEHLTNQQLNELRQGAQRVGNAAQEVVNPGIEVAQAAVARAEHMSAPALNALRQGGQRVSGAAQEIGERVQGLANPAVEAAGRAKTTIREALGGLKNQASNLGQQAAQALKDSAVGQKAVSAKEAAVALYENLGISRGKMAIPHQYGGCITLDNGGKSNPIANHLTGAIAKGYERNAQQQPTLRDRVVIGQRNENRQQAAQGHAHH